MGQHLACGNLLFGPQLALKRHMQWLAGEPFITNVDFDLQLGEQSCYFLETSARRPNAGRNPRRRR